MLAAFAHATSADDPVSALSVGERPEPIPPDGWVPITVRAASLNHHDVWTLRGAVTPAGGLPCVLGTDAAGVDDDGNEYVIHGVLGDPARGRGDETLDPERSVLSDAGHGTLAARIVVPRRNLVPKPAELSWAEAACLPTAWLTAYRMLFTKARARPGDRVLVQGAGGGVATAAILLARAAGLWVRVVTRDPAKADRAAELGAHEVVMSGTRLPSDCDVVLDTVGQATWKSSLGAVRPGGTVVLSGATTGFDAPTNLARLFSRQINVLGSTMGTRTELEDLIGFLVAGGVRPLVDSVAPLDSAGEQFSRLLSGQVFGKVVVEP
ncbi:zinc-binding dehydrogenase [Streptosporangium amethystogenes subsp. fukuiense]|uniref:Zinc-binding dehydrogenase n=1 Tax=Streptosporangium amethystogenes subsp. fukuiense TaxID=698418 RepID=A0ABW2SYY4_9ACTN